MTTKARSLAGMLDSNLNRRSLLKTMGVGGLALMGGGLSGIRTARAAGEMAFWATGTLDIGDGWSRLASDAGLDVTFTDNGNDPGPVVARLVAGNANDLFEVGGLQGGAEKELAIQGGIEPWDLSKIPNYDAAWQWAKDIPYLRHDGKQYGIPAVINADSIIYRSDKLGTVDSYGVIFDPKLKGQVAMEDGWINSVVFTAMYLKESENQKIDNPGNLSADELGLVMEFLIKHKRDGQFRTFWNGWEQGVQLVGDGEVLAMTGWEPIVIEGRKRGLQVDYAKPVEGYEGWANNLILLKGAVERERSDDAHAFANWLLDGFYGCTLVEQRGYVVPTDRNLAFAEANPSEFDAAKVKELTEHVKAKFAGKIYWQNARPDNFQLYEEWWQKLRNA